MSPALKDRRILIVDDEPMITSGLTALLESAGAVAVAAGSAKNAMDRVMADDLAFEIVISDHDLGRGANGIELIQSIRLHYGVDIPAILVSARRATTGDLAEPVSIVSKPFDAHALLRLIERFVQLRDFNA